MKKIARTLRTHRALLLNYFKARKEFSSGVVEGLNNKAKVTMRRSYGFRTVDARIKRQHFRRFCGQRDQPSARMQYGLYSSF